MSTQSATKVFSDIWAEWGDEALKAGCAGASVAAGDPALYLQCVEKTAKYNEMAKKMVSFWNAKASNGWQTIGPRRLDLDTDLDGTLVSTGGRMFISAAPLDSDRVNVVLRERGGKAKTKITVSRVAPNGAIKKLAEHELNDSTSEKKDDDQVLKLDLKGVLGCLLYVNLDAESVANTFKYTLKVSPN